MRARDLRQERKDTRRREHAARDAAGRNRPGLRRWRRFRRALGNLALRAFGPLLMRLLASTWRIERCGEAGKIVFDGDGPWVLALWHGRLVVPLALRGHARRGIAVLVSPSDDGGLASVALQRFGYRVVRGSLSRRGARALRELSTMLTDGIPVVITPDGPRGPRHAMNSGPTWLAHRAGVPLLGLAVAVDRAWRARSWDRLVIPKPFARIVLHYGDPVTVPADADDAGLEGIATALGETMLADERAAFARLGVADDQ